MSVFHQLRFVAPLLAVLVLNACGNSGSTIASGGIDGSGIISRGAISSFGSILVNGTEFDTQMAAVIVQGVQVGVGDPVVREHLGVGMVVTVEGTSGVEVDNAVAERIFYRNDVLGPVTQVQSIDATAALLVVMGQTVNVNGVTRFKAAAVDDLAVNNVVAVSGYRDDTGALWATYIERTADFLPGALVEVSGVVMDLDPDEQTFWINQLIVAYQGADTSRLPGGTPAEYQFVEVTGSLDTVQGVMSASRIDPELRSDAEDAAIEVIGFVTDFISITDFALGSQRVQVDTAADYVDGNAEDIGLGVKLEAEGQLVDGVLLAHEIEFWEPDQIEIEGIVTHVVSAAEFTVGDQVVRTHAETRFEGGTADEIEPLVFIEIKGRLVDGILLADKVSFE